MKNHNEKQQKDNNTTGNKDDMQTGSGRQGSSEDRPDTDTTRGGNR